MRSSATWIPTSTPRHCEMWPPSLEFPRQCRRAMRRRHWRKKSVTAEAYFVKFVAEHNLSFRSAEHFSKLVKVMFPDSKIAASFACSRTKTAAIINNAMAPELIDVVFPACRT
eukprot:scpid104105/ scgid22265/ 